MFKHLLVASALLLLPINSTSAQMYPGDTGYDDPYDYSDATDYDSISIDRRFLTPSERGQIAVLQARAEQREQQWLIQEDKKVEQEAAREALRSAAGGSISEAAVVLDGDTVVVSGIHIRLKGVDASELGNPQGEHARQVMIGIVGNSNLTCKLTGEKTHGREVGFCFTSDGTDINREIIVQGAALACPRYSDKYVQFEQVAAIKAQQRAKYCLKDGR